MMKRTTTGMALGLALVFTATAWSQESPMGHGKMGLGTMEMGKSSQKKSCMQMMGMMEMGEMETTNAGVDELVERMRAADGAEKMAAMEELLAALAAQQGETQKMMRSMPKMMCGGMMQMTMQ